MKKLSFFAALAAVLGLGACSGTMGVDLTDQKSVDKFLPSRLEKFIDPQSTVYEVSLGTVSDFTMEMDHASVEFLAPGATEAQNWSVDMFGNQKPRENKIMDVPSYDFELKKMVKKERTTENGIKLHDIDFSKIAYIVGQAVEIINAEGHTADGVKGLTIIFDGNPANTKYSFDLRSQKGTEFGQQHGRAALVTEYVEFRFEADAGGNVRYMGE